MISKTKASLLGKRFSYIMICFCLISCVNENYYPDSEFELNEIQTNLLNLYEAGDKISFTKKDSSFSIIVGETQIEKYNSYTNIGINRKIDLWKWNTFKNENDTIERPFFQCYVSPSPKEKSISISFPDCVGLFRSDSTLNTIKKEVSIEGQSFYEIYEIESIFLERVDEKGMKTMFISLKKGLIAIKTKDEEYWLNDEYF